MSESAWDQSKQLAHPAIGIPNADCTASPTLTKRSVSRCELARLSRDL